ncbi:radical SAM protein [Streptomyces sp. NPDC001410]|uniref:radical SAM protein n=1 Tax=Streptomyces sp. NPDC001410 TaxID=3364574 RepID=UPI0036C04261
MTVIAEAPAVKTAGTPRFLWLDLTRQCQLNCGHCHNNSGPDGTHGTMTAEDWRSVLGQAAAFGIPGVQFTGGEVTLHPNAPDLIGYARQLGLKVEVYSNLVHVTEAWWELLQCDGVTLATSYYSDRAEEHNAVTARPSHARTRVNIVKAMEYGIPIRVSVIVADASQTGEETRRELEALGVSDVRVDHVRPFGRGANGQEPHTGGLCGRCGTGRASIGPDGSVSPCVFSTWLGVGNVQDAPLAAILGGPEMARANAAIRAERGVSAKPCGPDDNDDECSPGFPGSECTPRN